MTWNAELKLAVQAAKAAGALLLEAARRPATVLSEENNDIKLQVDRDAEALILNQLAPSGHPVLAEESGEHGLKEGAAYWVVDPLDGTMNFSRGIPMCCVSIALCVSDTPVLGVIYDHNRDECFSGGEGLGAWLNAEPMSVSPIEQPKNAVLATGFPHRMDFSEPSMKAFLTRTRQFKKVRMIGTAALAAVYVACGRIDAYAEENTMLWDVAAGVALVKAAGGRAELTHSDSGKWVRNVRCASSQSVFDGTAEAPH
jgi:myo-inositol-1(or 4)-monophosphatase